jgi:hypothetical protein
MYLRQVYFKQGREMGHKEDNTPAVHVKLLK